MLNTIYENYEVRELPETTLEANPDDLNKEKIKALSGIGINRLSIGIQSFSDSDLQLMNRAHNAAEATACIEDSLEYIDNISIDLIYGIPGTSLGHWEKNLTMAMSYNLPHISSYALTVEPRTALKKFIEDGKVKELDEADVARQFGLLREQLEESGFVHYEISNFGLPGYFSENNTAYWKGLPYLGIGPSAHSFGGTVRSWNVQQQYKIYQSPQGW